ncbi:calcium-activated chloride channel-domain-containing protein [Clohesyomyces aquaticus]|uniref:Calcium-activated chloride channel-domain-containing protein n=1 Tax=Clohesyomyces aquaticus TaxID=1231657 RepID=A0A1Y2A5Q5_9PLEO|nr:calcium-activated chloride channel-domain-containing protein [Clohesyomyces aquaticus]
MAPPKSLQTNMDVDYVITYRFATTDKSAAVAKFEELVQGLSSVGLDTEVRSGDKHSILLFVRVASDEHLFGEVYRSRVRDWIHGVRAAAPPKETREALESEPLYEAERLRIIYQLITNPIEDGGAGITPGEGEWKNVESIFALHDNAYNKDWIKKWATSYFLTTEDLDDIRNRLGEKIAFYFAFTQSYFTFLFFPAAFGFISWLFLGHFSPIYGIVNAIWCTVFTEWWKHQEVDLGVRWGVRGVSRIETKRRDFMHEKEITDPVTGERVLMFPSTKRLQRQLLQIPFALVAASLLGALIATCFGIEVFISEIYNGPFKSLLVFLPTGIATTVMPILSGILTNFATKLTEFENYQTHGAYETALTQKIFVLNFITSYLPIFLTAFVYVPFGTIIVPYLDVFSLTVRPFAENEKQMTAPKVGSFAINPDRLRKQVIYFTVTAQIVNLGMELVVPYLKRRGFSWFKQKQSERAAKRNGSGPAVSANDPPEDAAFLTRVREEAELGVYDVTSDLREMVIQFGYLSLFSVVWPFTPVSFLINDWFELRADAIKICVEMQRPTPWRADTIGPWLDSLSFLAWLGSLTTSALVYMFSNDGLGPGGHPKSIEGWALLLSVMLSEHLFILLRWGVRLAISKLDSPGLQKERRDRFLVRKKYFEESLSELKRLPTMADKGEEITRKSLEEDAREGSLRASTPESRFWSRQRGWRETVMVGKGLIEKAEVESSPERKKEL